MDKQNYIEGYKAFESDFTTAHENISFKEMECKHIDGEIKSGPIGGHGFHLCKNFEDTFRFFGDNPILCEVIGFGIIGEEYTDDYNDYDGIYACSDIYIKRVIPREEIIDMALELPNYRLERLIQTYKMTDEEIERIENNLPPYSDHTKKIINYYHRNDKNAFR